MKFDCHGYSCEEAMNVIDKHIDNFAAYGVQDEVYTVITGRGKIRDALTLYLQDQNIDWIYQPGNTGTILIFLKTER